MRRIAHDQPEAKSARPLPVKAPAFSRELSLAEDTITTLVIDVLDQILGEQLPRAALLMAAQRALSGAELRCASGEQGPDQARQLRAVVHGLEHGAR